MLSLMQTKNRDKRGGAVFSKPGTTSMEMAEDAVGRNAWTVSSRERLRPAGGPLKRAFDIIASATALVSLFPLLVVVSILVAATNKGPVLFWSWRIGYLGKSFYMPKFRTMYVSAPVKSRECLGDARDLYTPIGKFLRLTSIDELPQFWSILKGDMSLIGPRPLLMNDPAAAQRMMRPLSMQSRPGITGLAQINGRNHLTARKKVSYDVAYTRLWSWQMDAKITYGTIRYILTGHGIL